MNRKSESGIEKSPRGAMGRHVLVGGGGGCGVFGAAWSSLGLKSFGNSSGNSYTKFAILDIMRRFTCG